MFFRKIYYKFCKFSSYLIYYDNVDLKYVITIIEEHIEVQVHENSSGQNLITWYLFRYNNYLALILGGITTHYK